MHFKLYIHPLCSLCYRIVKRLMMKNLVERVKILSVSTKVEEAITCNVWSVPWLIINDEYVIPSPISPEEVENYVKGDFSLQTEYNVDSLLENFKNAVIYSLAASAITYLHKSLKPLLNTTFPKIASRIPILKPELRIKALNELLQEIGSNEDKIYSEIEDSVIKYLAINFVRERYWLVGDTTGENISKYLVAHWLLAKATFGRVGLPYPAPVNLLNNVNELYSEIVNNYSKYMRSVIFRLNMINRDTKYLEFISKLA